MRFIDLFSGHAKLYAAARPSYPAELFHFLASTSPARGRVWDCGTGNGQAASGLIHHFDEVEATDASAAQIANALQLPRVRYSVQPAERTSFPNAHFDAICVAQALHWFDFEQFYPEAHRVLRPGGLFAAWAYDFFSIEPAIDEAFRRHLFDIVKPYWAPENELIWNGYRDVPFPFTRVETPDFAMHSTWTLRQLFAFAGSWSAVRRCCAEQGEDWLESAALQLLPLWGLPDTPRTVHMRFHLVAGIHQPA